MQLRDYQIARTRITLPGKAVNGERPFFEVRGLCLDDMTFLIQQHLGPITRALKLYQESREDILASGSINGFVMTLAKDFPALAVEVISAATDSLDEATRNVARELPVTVQIAALTEIARLSLDEAGGLKNLLAEMRAKIAASVESVSADARPEMN